MSIKDNLEKNFKSTAISSILSIIDKNPEKNVDKIFKTIKKVVRNKDQLAQVNSVYEMYKNQPATYEFIQNILKKTDKKCLKKFVTNFFANAVWFGNSKRQKYLEKENTKIPFVLLISPSMKCNLKCIGCYAADYDKEKGISPEEMDRIVGEARDLGIYYIIILGGEPFLNEYMFDIYEKYNDIMFTPFTNGTLIDERIADKMKELGNIIPMFSLEGFEKDTDVRRGKGTFKKVMHAMDLLDKRGVLFGVSTATTSKNIDVVTSDKFVDMLIEKGSKMNWYFLFMPVGTTEPDLDLMLSPEQRAKLGERIRNIRKSKPYFMIDFFNDAPFVGGCIAGKFFCHINSNEDVESCIFAHFATKNLKNIPLIESFRDPFFKQLRQRQPYTENMLRPCMMIDNPHVVREICRDTGAKPTDSGGRYMLENEDFKFNIQKIADEWKVYADREWERVFNEKGNDKMSKG